MHDPRADLLDRGSDVADIVLRGGGGGMSRGWVGIKLVLVTLRG